MKRLLLYIVCMMSVVTSYGQKMNTSVSLGGSYTGGNFNSYLLNSQISIGQDTTKLAWNIAPTFTYGKIYRNNKWDINQRESYMVSSLSYRRDSHRIIAFSEIENSYLRKIDFRGSIGLGYGYGWSNKKGNFKVLVSEAIVPETYQSDIYVNRNLNTLRLSTRIKLEYSGKVKITSISLVQPSLWNDKSVSFENNINARFNNNLDVPINKNLLIGLQLNAFVSTFSTFVDSDVKPFDYNFVLLLKYKNF